MILLFIGAPQARVVSSRKLYTVDGVELLRLV
jgi:hypothetical protein